MHVCKKNFLHGNVHIACLYTYIARFVYRSINKNSVIKRSINFSSCLVRSDFPITASPVVFNFHFIICTLIFLQSTKCSFMVQESFAKPLVQIQLEWQLFSGTSLEPKRLWCKWCFPGSIWPHCERLFVPKQIDFESASESAIPICSLCETCPRKAWQKQNVIWFVLAFWISPQSTLRNKAM